MSRIRISWDSKSINAWQTGSTPVLEHSLKSTLGNVLLHETFRHIGQAEPRERGIEHLRRSVKGELTFDAHL